MGQSESGRLLSLVGRREGPPCNTTLYRRLIQNAVSDWAAQTLASLVSGVVGSLKQGL